MRLSEIIMEAKDDSQIILSTAKSTADGMIRYAFKNPARIKHKSKIDLGTLEKFNNMLSTNKDSALKLLASTKLEIGDVEDDKEAVCYPAKDTDAEFQKKYNVPGYIYPAEIIVNFSQFEEMINDPNPEGLMDYYKNEISKILAHEIRHALDSCRSGGKERHNYNKVPKDPNKPYLTLPTEINAHFQEILHDISNDMEHYFIQNKKPMDVKSAEHMSLEYLEDSKLGQELDKDSTEYRRLYIRLLKEIQHIIEVQSKNSPH